MLVMDCEVAAFIGFCAGLVVACIVIRRSM